MLKKIYSVLGIISLVFIISCGGGDETKTPEKAPEPAVQESNPLENKGIGPIKQVTLNPTIDEKMVDAGQKVYKEKCTSCHKEYEKYIGPAPVGIFERRSPEWIMNMILNPEEMIQKDPIAKDLIKQFASPMANQHLTEVEARSVLEYFRTLKK